MSKYNDGTCPVCGGDLYLDDSQTELHCETCEYTTSVEAMEMCKYMCPDPEDDLLEELAQVKQTLIHEEYYKYAEVVQRAIDKIGGNE